MFLPHLLVPAPWSTGLRGFGYLVCSPRAVKRRQWGGSVLHPSFSSNLAMVAVIFMSVALKKWKGHPEHAPYGGGFFGGDGR